MSGDLLKFLGVEYLCSTGDDEADLVEAGERFLCADAALRGCEADCIPRLEGRSPE
jgi:hypothetical protein